MNMKYTILAACMDKETMTDIINEIDESHNMGSNFELRIRWTQENIVMSVDVETKLPYGVWKLCNRKLYSFFRKKGLLA